MAGSFKQGMSALLFAGLGIASMAQAEVRTLSGQFMDVTFDDYWLPISFNEMQLIETPFQWDCDGANCAITGSPTASIVWRNTNGEAVTVEDRTSFLLNFQTSFNSSVNVVDPHGKEWGIAAVDNGKWHIGVNVTGQDRPDDAQFATSYARLRSFVDQRPRVEMGGGQVVPTWWDLPSDFAMTRSPWTERPAYTGSTTIGLDQTGASFWGPGLQALTLLEEDGTNATNGLVNSNWVIMGDLSSAYYALPSTTDSRCASLTCMNFAAGNISVDSVVFQMAITPTAVASVPESSTWGLFLLGLAAMGWRHRRCATARRG